MGIKARSINRAAKRGHFINWMGEYSHTRPFNNRANTSKRKGVHSRTESQENRQLWESIKSHKNNKEDEQAAA